ncbi:MAG: hypothetical protein ABIP95_15275 [Pelobium sp.]
MLKGALGVPGASEKRMHCLSFSITEPIAIAVLRSSGNGFFVALPSKNQRCSFYDGGGMVKKAPVGQKRFFVLFI